MQDEQHNLTEISVLKIVRVAFMWILLKIEKKIVE